MAVGLPIFIVLVGKPEKPFVKLLFTKEALEGCKHEFETSLSHEGRLQCLRTTSCRLTEVSDSVRGLCCLARFFEKYASPVEDEAECGKTVTNGAVFCVVVEQVCPVCSCLVLRKQCSHHSYWVIM